MSAADRLDSHDNLRSSRMMLMQEQLARERMRDAQRRAAQQSQRHRLAAARRWQRRAERASYRARLALSAVG